MAAGVALAKIATLGTSPISSISNVVSMIAPITIGQATMIFMTFLVLLEWVILGRGFSWINVAQLPPSLLFGYLIDFFVKIFTPIAPSNYLVALILTLISVAVLAFGVYLTINSNTIVMAGEGLAEAVSLRFNQNFGKMKVVVDSSMVILAVAVSLIFTQKVIGVREGTIISALFTGRIVEFYELTFHRLTLWLND